MKRFIFGEGPPMKLKNTTVKDIAEYTHLSLGTVSKYINGGQVKDDNKRKLDEAIANLDYHVNTFARGLKTQKSKTIGILIPALDNYFCTNLVEDIERTLYRFGYSLLVCGYQNNPQLIQRKLDFLASRMVDGIIVVPSATNDSAFNLDSLSDRPVILVDRYVNYLDLDTVGIDSVKISTQVTNYLVEQGHKKIAIILGSDTISTSIDRKNGFMTAMNAQGLTVPSEYIKSGEYSYQHGYEAMKEILTLRDRPSAVFATNFDLTLGMMQAVKEDKIVVPEDISIVGFDNLLYSRLFTPSLTIVEQPLEEISSEVVKVLMERLKDKKVKSHKTIKLEASLVQGSSVKKI